MIQLIESYLKRCNHSHSKQNEWAKLCAQQSGIALNSNPVRVYLAACGLGSEPLLVAISAHFHWPIYLDPSEQRQRYKQLLALNQTSKIITDQPHSTPLHLIHSRLFQQFAQVDRKARIERFRVYKSEITPALYLKPSTMWYIHNLQHSASPRSKELADQNSNTRLARISARQSSNDSILTDSFGVSHCLYSTHSDAIELMEFVQFMQPKMLVPINTPKQPRQEEWNEYGSKSPISNTHSPRQIEFAVVSELQKLLFHCYPNSKVTITAPSQVQSLYQQHKRILNSESINRSNSNSYAFKSKSPPRSNLKRKITFPSTSLSDECIEPQSKRMPPIIRT